MFGHIKPLSNAATAGLLLSLTLFSCDNKEKETIEPDNPYLFTEKKMIGKWEVKELSITLFEDRVQVSSYGFFKDFGEVRDGLPVGSGPWIPEEHTTYLVLNADHSFYHTNISGDDEGFMLYGILAPKDGTWAWKNDSTMEFSTYTIWDNSIRTVEWRKTSFDGYGLSLKYQGQKETNSTPVKHEELREIVIAPVN